MKFTWTTKIVLLSVMAAGVTALICGISYAKENQSVIIQKYGKEIFRTCAFFQLYPVCEFKNGRGHTTFTFKKPDFTPVPGYKSSRNLLPPGSSGHVKAPAYFNYKVSHTEGFAKGVKTYNDKFEGIFTVGDPEQGVAPQSLDLNTPVSIYFNGMTVNSTLGEGNKCSKDLGSGEDVGGYSTYKVDDSLTQSRLEVVLRWTKTGKVQGSFKGYPLKTTSKYEAKFNPVTLTDAQKEALKTAGKTEQWYYATGGGPMLSIKVGAYDTWTWNQLAYTGADKEKTDSKSGDTAETWSVKGKTAWWGNY